MTNKKIFVGIEYKDAFDSICALINGNCFEGLPYSAENGIISDGVYQYVLSKKKTQNESEQKFVFEKDGASWFKALRGEKTPDNDAIWNTFRSNIAIEYHKRFSVVEYKKKSPSKQELNSAIKKATLISKEICEYFYPDLSDKIDVKPAFDVDTLEDMYGVAVKIELSGGTGETLPVLGKIYFNKDGKVMVPIENDVAYALEQTIESIIPEEDTESTVNMDSAVLDNALDGVQALIESDKNFADYLCFSSEQDLKAVNGLLSKLSHSAIELECQRVDVLYITHVQTTAFEYMVYSQNNPIFKIALGINDAVSIYCANCQEKTLLIKRNQISYTDSNGKIKIATLKFFHYDLGVDKYTLELIKNSSILSKHVKTISCKDPNGKTICTRVRCESQIFATDKESSAKFACKECPYPEIVYTSLSGEKLYTPSLVFAFDHMDLVHPSDVATAVCKNCGRTFSASSLKGMLCPTCFGAESQFTDKAKKLYKEYKEFLPISVRLSPTGKKGAFEDGEIILFVVGKKQYLFNKLGIKDFGYVAKPKRIQ